MDNKSIQYLLNEPAIRYKTSSSRMELVELSRKGIRKDVLDKLADTLGVSMKQFAQLLPVTERTLQRREPSSLLNRSISEHAILIAEILALGLNVFGDEEKLQRWMHDSNIGLGGHTPFSLLDTAIGAELVKDELNRMDYGVHS
ncbi:MAG: antitoxin Xre/MbcA/ParS toxin-binding domain-containing protein [Balneolaceae bacterium]|nr:antitoxin Xre/MbcA/ParS toxin-binding domain-containing protein [Balneolaceae bacterium]